MIFNASLSLIHELKNSLRKVFARMKKKLKNYSNCVPSFKRFNGLSYNKRPSEGERGSIH